MMDSNLDVEMINETEKSMLDDINKWLLEDIRLIRRIYFLLKNMK